MIALEPQERIYLLKRRHQIILKLRLAPFVFLLSLNFLAILFLFLLKFSLPQILLEQFPRISTVKLNFFFAFLFSLILPVVWSAIFFEITKYYLTYWVITNQRIIEVKLIGLFNVEYSSIELEKIQDIKISIVGPLPSFFRFGNLEIETAGTKGEFVLDQIGDPELVKQIIFEAKLDYQKIKT
jgi:membrane protein YdbS with pleckstrin-like domain